MASDHITKITQADVDDPKTGLRCVTFSEWPK